jgi:calcineurin-like phosphoesterase family protein
MIKVLHIRGSENVFFTSDTHLNHNKEFVFKARGFNTSQEHTDFVIQKINSLVGQKQILFHLGDVFLNTKEEEADAILDRIVCENIYVLWGNHPNPLRKIYFKQLEKMGVVGELYPFRYKNLIFLGDYVEAVIENQVVVMSHYPITSWNYMKDGSWCLSGHCHNNLADTRVENPNGFKLDVGWDGHGKPLSFNNLQGIMAKKQICVIDHHKNP